MIAHQKSTIKSCFWIFLFLLLTEGIFRRWLFPSLNNVFLVARDPFVLYAIYVGYRAGLLKDLPAIIMLALSVLCFISALIFGHGNVIVALYGARILLYYPFIFICARVLTRNDILKVGRIFVLLITPMTLLCMVQFVSPQSSFVNIGVGGDEAGAGFGGALGYYRPPGIFTFIAALTDYYGVSLSFLLYFITNTKDARKMHLSRTVILLSVIFYIISIPVSISRTHFAQTALICAFYLMISLNNAKTLQKVLLSITIVVFAIFLISITVPDINLYLDVFFERFNSANNSEGGLFASAYERSFGWAFRAWQKTSLMGYGDGYFTNVGLKILEGDVHGYTGKLSKISDATEMEWGRVLCEDGFILGAFILLMRFIISIDLFLKAKSCINVNGDVFPWISLPFTFIFNLWIPLRSPYHLGFCTVITISCLTVVRYDQKRNIFEMVKQIILKNKEPFCKND